MSCEWEPTLKEKLLIEFKDRGAILPAGHFANWAFWYSKTGSFISSSFMVKVTIGFENSMMKSITYINNGWDLLAKSYI
jgi:hypothetical protein